MGILDDAIREHLELKRSHGASDDEISRKEAEAFGPARQELPDETSVLPPAEFAEAPVPEAPAAEPIEDDGFDTAFADEPPAQPADALAEAPGPDAPAFGEPSLAEPPPEPPPEPPLAEPPHQPPPSAFDEPSTAAFAPDPAAAPGAFAPEPPPPDPLLDQPTEDFDPFAAEIAPDPVPPAPVHDHLDERDAPPEPVFPAGERPAPVEEPPAEEAPVDEPPVGDPPVEQPPVEGDAEDVLEETPEFLQDTPEHDRLWFEQKPPRDFDFGS